MNRSSKPLSLMPKEHGAYAEMGFPQVAALILGGADLPALLLATAVVCGFFLYEPILVIVGRRGPRARKQAGRRAKQRATTLLVIGFASGLGGLSLSPPVVWWATLAVVGLGLVVARIVALGFEKSVLGESTVAVTFAAAAVPTALAAGTPLSTSLTSAGVWAVVFVLGTMTVNAVIGQHKRGGRRAASMLVGAAVMVGVAAIGASGSGGTNRALLAVLPAAVACALVILLRLTPRRLRLLGWSFVASNIATLVLLIVFLG